MYRPEFAYPTPDGFVDQDCDQYFDSNTTPFLAQSTPNLISNIPLQLDKDADFLWRGVKIPILDYQGIQNVAIQLRAPGGRYITADFVPIWLFGIQVNQGDGLTGGPGCVLEPGIYCPKGSVILLDTLGIGNGGATLLEIVLTGVKRWPKALCCGETCRA
jgi:hypothetical protein